MKRTKLVAVAVVVGLAVQLLGMTGAFSQKVGNPSGPFTYTIHNGSIRINDQSFTFDDQHTPQCRDGVNNDTDFLGSATVQDNNVDFSGGDTQCTSPDDDSEVQGGFQAVQPVTVTGNINGAGAWTVNPTTGVFFPPAYAFADNPAGGTFIVTIVITGRTGAPGAWTGSLDPLSGAANLAMQLRVSITGGPITSNCHIGDDTGADTLVAQAASTKPGGSAYNPSNGALAMADAGFRVPPAKDCGSILFVPIAGQINDAFGIPTTDTDALFTGDFAPGNRPTRAINPNLTVTPGVACRPTSFSSAGTTSSQLATNYQFDHTNNGTFEQSGLGTTSSETFATSGPRTARLKVTDLQGDSAEVLTSYTVGPNLQPTAPNQNLARSAAGASVNFTLGGSDPEGGAVTRSIIVNPVNGTISGTPPNLTYTPNPGFGGSDVLTYQVQDDCAESPHTTGTVTFNVNRLPVPNNQSITTTQEIPVNVTLTGSDADADNLTFTVVDQPTNGQLVGTEPTLQYIPDPGFNGIDTFTFRANDGLNDSAGLGTISINVVKNERPVATPQAVTTPEDTGIDITLAATDADGDTLTYSVLAPGTTNGTLSGTPPLLHYDPNPNFSGGDSFTFRADDGKGGISDATVTITVTPVDDPPVANDQSFVLQQDTSRSFTVDATDVDSSLSFTPTTAVANGVLTGSFPNFTYIPNSGFIGVDTLVYDVSDGTSTDSATVVFNVVATNQPPVAGSAVVNTSEDLNKAITLNASDPEGDPVTIVITDQPDHGVLLGTAPNLTYDPDPNYFGPDSFQFSVEDSVEQVSFGTISINVIAVNDPPVAQAQTVSVIEDVPTSIVLSAIDPDDVVGVTYLVTSTAAHGTVTGTAPNVTYTPLPNYNGPDSFTFRARDPQGATTTATITINVTPVNDVPKANNISKTVAEDGTVALTLTGSDADGDALTFHIVLAPQNGTLLGSAPNLTYKPNANYNGFETFSYRSNDGQLDSNAATITVAVTAVNDAPVAQAQAVNATEDTPTPITVVGTDVDGDALVYKVEQAPLKGKLTGTVPNVTYTPNADYNGADSFKFSVTDPKGLKSTATVTITVQPAPLIATKLVAETVIAKLNPLTLTWNYPKFKATLTRPDTNQPLAGRTVEFWVNGKKLCQAVTTTAGVATCSGSANTFKQTYLAIFNGDHDFAATQAEGVVLK